MVNPVNTHRLPSQTPTAKQQTPESGKSGQVFSPGDLQALRRRIKPGSQDDTSAQHQDRQPDAEAQATQKTKTIASRNQGQTRARAGHQVSRALTRPRTDKSLSRPLGDFDVQPAVDGSQVLVSGDGKILHNLQGPIAKTIYDYLCSTCPQTERPTVWLDALFGRMPIKAIQDYLDRVTDEENNAIFINGDGHLDVGTIQNTAPDDSYVYVVKKSAAS